MFRLPRRGTPEVPAFRLTDARFELFRLVGIPSASRRIVRLRRVADTFVDRSEPDRHGRLLRFSCAE